MRRAVAYLRVNSANQNHALQRGAIERAAAARGAEIAEWAEEKASGGRLERPVLQDLRGRARAGELGELWVYRLDRLTRTGIKDTLALIQELAKNGCKVRTVADGFDVDGPGAELVIAVLAWAAEMERGVIRERQKTAREKVEREGGRWGRPAKIAPRTLRRALQLQKEGKTLREIAVIVKEKRSTLQRALAQKGHYSRGSILTREMGLNPPRPASAQSGQEEPMEPFVRDQNGKPLCPRCGRTPPSLSYTWPGQPASTCCPPCRGELETHAMSIGLVLQFQVYEPPAYEPPAPPAPDPARKPYEPPAVERRVPPRAGGPDPEQVPEAVPNQITAENSTPAPSSSSSARSTEVEPRPRLIELDAKWESGNRLTWLFQRPTRVTHFELRGPKAGMLESLMVGNEEQLAAGPVPVEVLASGWRVTLPTMNVGTKLELKLHGFEGEIRPHGEQVPR